MERVAQCKMNHWSARISCGRMLASLALVGAGMCAGAALSPNAALGEVKPVPEPQTFQTGDQLALPVLKDIAATLHQMDARLAKLETVSQQWRASKVNPAPAN